MSSDIQVSVRWKEQTIFAGEDVECIITFKNVAENRNSESGGRPQLPRPNTPNASSNGDRFFSLKTPQSLFFNNTRRSISQNHRQKSSIPSHRPSASVGSPFASHSFPPHNAPIPSHERAPNNKHKRSVSILSIESEKGVDKLPVSQFTRSRPAYHGRSASLQTSPKRTAGTDDISPLGQHLLRGSFFTEPTLGSGVGYRKTEGDRQLRLSRPGSSIASPIIPVGSSRVPHSRTAPLPTDFRFPAPSSLTGEPSGRNPTFPSSQTSNNGAPMTLISPRPNTRDTPSISRQSHLAPVTKIFSDSGMNGSSRSSGEFYTLSNNSTETLESEYTSYSVNHSRANHLRHARHYSSVDTVGKLRDFETLLMGYAQISASFTVDGSLIHQAAFEEVKRKGVLGCAVHGAGDSNQGTKGRRSGGLWGALGWNTIEDSINGLLSKNDLNGLRDMRGVTSSKSIPLLSTPQSLLFVDLRLSPGEEKSFSFAFTLPRGLPASHKGKAIKFSYHLVIGTQRHGGAQENQHVNRINIPFRVFSGVNASGDVLGHDLMIPYVLLRDEARVQRVGSGFLVPTKEKSISGPSWTSSAGFLSYIDEILERDSSRDSSLSTKTSQERFLNQDVSGSSASCKDAIDLAILGSNQVTNSNRSANRFEIARNGRRIAVVVLNRPSHRLGETIIATIDFADAALPCYSLRATLETSEKITPSLAMRSSTSINRATRRIYASYFENTLFSTHVVFSPAIPISATPTIVTSGVNLEWELRFEFVTTTSHSEGEASPSGTNLLELVGEDDRGSTFTSLENLSCESFEISLPLTVYGETVREPAIEETQGYPI